MRAFQSLALFCLPFATAVLAQETPQSGSHNIPHDLNEAFHELLDILPEESIQDALHKHFQQKFKAGVFQFNKKAVEAVHSTNAPLATKLVIDAARHGLVRRQNNGTTTRLTTSASQSSQTVPVPTAITTTDASGKTVTKSTTFAGVVETTTNAAGSTLITTKAAPTADETTNVVVEPTTLSDGSLVYLTKTVIGKLTPTQPAGDNSPAPTHTPGLQNAAGRNTRFAVGVAVVAVGTFLGVMLV